MTSFLNLAGAQYRNCSKSQPVHIHSNTTTVALPVPYWPASAALNEGLDTLW